MYVVRRPPPPGGVGYEESWLTSSIVTACGSHHRQMVDERYKRPPQTSTAWRRWLRTALATSGIDDEKAGGIPHSFLSSLMLR